MIVFSKCQKVSTAIVGRIGRIRVIAGYYNAPVLQHPMRAALS
jgi:hypothetical protein